MFFKSISDLNKDIIFNLHRIPKDIDLVVGVPRSGLLVANIIALHLNVPLVDLDGFIEGKVFQSGVTRRAKDYDIKIKNPKKILIVEDSVCSGRSIENAREKILALKREDIEVLFFAAYVAPDKEKLVDIYLDVCELPRVFEWNIMHHEIIEKSCFDLDGVLCIDPNESDDDDGEIYKSFLRGVKPLFVPTKEIGNIVTCRLEKYRVETEEWLKRNNIKYKNLIMMNYKSKEERRKAGKHAEYKAENYKKTNSSLFIESDLRQAISISKIANKPVFCIEVQKMIYPNNKIDNNYFGKPGEIFKLKLKLKRNLIKLIKKILNRN